MVKEKYLENEEESLWHKNSYIKPINPNDSKLEERMKYFEDNPEAPKEFDCKKCNTKIGKHNLYWHEGMCNECFFDTYFPDTKK